MDCFIRACKQNKEGQCQKYTDRKQVKEDFEKGGGCAYTWYMSGQIPKTKEAT